MLSKRSERGHFMSTVVPPHTNTPRARWELYAKSRRETALEKLGTLLVIAAFPIQLLDIFKPHLLSTLYLNKVFFLLAHSKEKPKQHYH